MPTPKAELTEEIIERLVGDIRTGSFLVDAARREGISRWTLQRWRARGRLEPNTIYGQLEERIKAAEASLFDELGAEARSVARREGDWRGLAWYAAKRCPERYGEHPTDIAEQVHRELDDLIVSLRDRMSESAYAELVRAISGMVLPSSPERGEPARLGPGAKGPED